MGLILDARGSHTSLDLSRVDCPVAVRCDWMFPRLCMVKHARFLYTHFFSPSRHTQIVSYMMMKRYRVKH
jgi:hypothetical protein